jgi:hypothetical protein
MKLKDHIAKRTVDYGNLDLFRAFAEDRIPLEKFPDFFREQYMTARWFQDLIWATTEIHEGPYAAFAKKHRKVDSGHHRMMKFDLKAFGLTDMTDDDWFRLEWLPTRMQMSRILSLCYNASPETLLVILASLESAGDVTLGTLFGYVERHGIIDKTHYLGKTHIEIEKKQVTDIYAVAPELMNGEEEKYHAVIDTVFDALTIMFSEGGKRYYKEYIYADLSA